MVENSRSTVRWNSVRVLLVVVHLEDQPAVVLDVLEGVRQIVHESRRDLSEHRMALLLAHVLLQCHQTVGHPVEPVPEAAQLGDRVDVDPLVETSLGDRARRVRDRHDGPDEGTGPDGADEDHDEQGEADRGQEFALVEHGRRERLTSRLFHQHEPLEFGDPHADAQQRGAVLALVLVHHRLFTARRGHRRDDGVLGHRLATGDQRLSIGVSVSEQLAPRVDQQRDAALADPDPADHAPQLLDAELADEPAAALGSPPDGQRHRSGRQPVVVEGDRRHRDAKGTRHDRFRDRQPRATEVARGFDLTGRAELGQLAELRKPGHEVLEDAVLLIDREVRVLQVGRERLEDLEVGGDVATDLLANLFGDDPVSLLDRDFRAGAEE